MLCGARAPALAPQLLQNRFRTAMRYQRIRRSDL